MIKKTVIFLLAMLPLLAQAQSEKTQLSVWANEAIVETYTFNYKNYLKAQKEIAKYFTADGWKAYSQALLKSKLLDTVKKNKYKVNAVATAPPQVKTRAKGNWQAVMPVLVVYENPQYQQKQHLKITITFKRVPQGQGIRGLAITSFESKIEKQPCRCKAVQPNNN